MQKVNPVDIKIIESVEDIIFDSDHNQDTEDTMTLLNRYVDSIETDLNKSRIKGLIHDVYREACEVML